MQRLLTDVRMALRGFRRTPAFAATIVSILGLGIGMAVAVFTVFRVVFVRRLPVQAQDQLVVLWTHLGNPSSEVSGNFKQLMGQARPEMRTVRGIAGLVHWGATPSPFTDGDRSITLARSMVTGNFFEVLGARPIIGRLLRPEDDDGGEGRSFEPARRAYVMVISYGAWQRRFGGDRSVIGRRLVEPYQQIAYTIVGVAPPGLDFPTAVEAWTPPWSSLLSAYAVARLAPGATPVAARDEFFAVENRIFPEVHLVGATVTPFSRAVLGDVQTIVAALTAAALLLLVIACVNVGNLMLLRATSRSREIAIRRALGASYGDVALQLVVESATLGLMGGALGLACAEVLLRVLVTLAPAKLPSLDSVRVAGLPLGGAIGVTTATVAIFGLLPALSAAGSSLASPLRLDSRSGTETRGRRRVRQSLVGAQIALALVLLTGAGLLVRSLERLVHLDLGFRRDHLAILSFAFPVSRYNGWPKVSALGADVIERLRAIPGVRSITQIALPPFMGANVIHGRPTLEGQTPEEAAKNPSIPLEVGNEDYFRTFDIPIVRGRGLLDSDRENTPQVAVVSESVARRLWPGQDPIGKRMQYWAMADTTQWRTVVGVAGDIRFRTLREATPTIYVPWRQGLWQFSYAARTTGDLTSVLRAVRREAHAVEPGLELWQARSLEEFLAEPLAEPRLTTVLLSAFGLMALVLAALGLYGVMATIVRDETRDIGVRLALGATAAQVRREVLGRAFVVTCVGASVGLVVALAGSRLLAALLFNVTPTDPITLGASSAVLFAVALVAAYLPARRATRIDPVIALRAE
jgi:predicted permease